MFLSKRQSGKIGPCVITAVLTSVLMLCHWQVQVRNDINLLWECTCICEIKRASTYHSLVFSQEQDYTIVHQWGMCVFVCAECWTRISCSYLLYATSSVSFYAWPHDLSILQSRSRPRHACRCCSLKKSTCRNVRSPAAPGLSPLSQHGSTSNENMRNVPLAAFWAAGWSALGHGRLH